MDGYAGSIAATPDRILITSPKGGALMLFDATAPTSPPTTAPTFAVQPPGLPGSP